MVHGTVRSLFQLLGALGMTALALGAWLGLRLAQGPVDLSYLTPYMEEGLSSPDGRLTTAIEHTILLWKRDNRTLELEATGVTVSLAGQGIVASVPEVSVALSGPGLLQGVIAPRSLKLRHPAIFLTRSAEGTLSLGIGVSSEAGGNSKAAADAAFQALLSAPGASAAGELRSIEVLDADLSIEDRMLSTTWHAPHANLLFRRDPEGIHGRARIALDLAGESGRLDIDGAYKAAGRKIVTSLSFSGLRPALFAELTPQLAPLSALKLPVGGTLDLAYALDGGFSDMRFDLVGGKGTIDAQPWLKDGVAVDALALKGAFANGLDHLSIAELRVDLGGPVVTAGGTIDGLDQSTPREIRASLDASVTELPLDRVAGLWPEAVLPKPRAWVVANIANGRVHKGEIHLVAHRPAGAGLDGLTLDMMKGGIDADGVTVHYLAPLTPVVNAAGQASFDSDSLTIDVKGGTIKTIAVTGGRIVFSGFSQSRQDADIVVEAAGPAVDALSLIDEKPLGWASLMGLDAKKVTGGFTSRISVKFPLLASLGFDQLDIKAHTETKDLAIPGAALGLDLDKGSLAVDIDPKGMTVSGKADIGGAPAAIAWRENFTKTAPRSLYRVSMVADDAARRILGLDQPPFQAPYLTGPVPVEIQAALKDRNSGEITLKADLGQAAMALPNFNWDKKAGTAGQGSALVRLAGGRLADIPSFAVKTADGLDLEGQLSFENGQPRLLSLQRAKWGRTDIKGSLAFRPGGLIAVDLAGPSFDARELAAGVPSDHQTDKAQPKSVKREQPKPDRSHREEGPPLSVQARFGRIWIGDDGYLHDAKLTMSRDRFDWQSAEIEALVGQDKSFRLSLQPAPGHHRQLKLTSADAGAVFRVFGFLSNAQGGELNVEGSFDDNDPRQPLKGTATATNFQIYKAPALARLLNVAALTSILDVLSGDGIHFDNMVVPFSLADGTLDIADARAHGSALGITAKGQIDLDRDLLALEGTIVPIYAVNSVLGRLPVVGSLFSAEKGGGFLAVNYRVKGPSEDPEVRVNPLSALTPGFLRRLFDIFDDGSGSAVPKADSGK